MCVSWGCAIEELRGLQTIILYLTIRIVYLVRPVDPFKRLVRNKLHIKYIIHKIKISFTAVWYFSCKT